MYCDWPRLGRCCFCMPLRRGVLTCAYLNLFFSAFMLGLYCYAVHYTLMAELVLVGRSVGIIPAEVCILFYCLELVFNAVLIYGAHKLILDFLMKIVCRHKHITRVKKLLKYVQAFYYYTIVTCVALLVVQIVDIFGSTGSNVIEKSIFIFAGVCLQLYLITLVRSLVKNLEELGPHTYENQLHPIANGDLNVESNGIYNNTTVIPIDA